MRNLYIYSILACCLFVFLGCSSSSRSAECRIHGIVPDKSKEGIKVFLVPVDGVQDAAHVDSTVIKDGKFEFTKDSTGMGVIRLDYHYRDNVQELLVVTEPGDVNVTIGPNSTTAGTPQNDSLQAWKDQIIRRNVAYNQLRYQNDRHPSDSATNKLKAMQKDYLSFNKAFRSRQPAGVFKDFLKRITGEKQ